MLEKTLTFYIQLLIIDLMRVLQREKIKNILKNISEKQPNFHLLYFTIYSLLILLKNLMYEVIVKDNCHIIKITYISYN